MYRKDFLDDTPEAMLNLMAHPPYEDPMSLRDLSMQPNINLRTGRRAERMFFARNIYHFGGSGTSTSMHAHRASWLRLHSGAKVWFLYPPRSRSAPRMMHNGKHMDRYTSSGLVTSWLFREDHPHAPPHPILNFSYAQSVREGVSPKVCIQRAGTFMFVGDDWMHGLINVGLTVATATFSQIAHTTEPAGSASVAAYFAEYPVGGHTVRSKPLP
jgi:hypothetical protein